MHFPRSSGSDNKRQAHDAHPPFVPKLRYFCYAIADKNLIPSVLPFHIFFRNPIVILGRRRSHSYYYGLFSPSTVVLIALLLTAQ